MRRSEMPSRGSPGFTDSPAPLFRWAQHGGRYLDLVAVKDRQGVGAGGGVGNGRAGGDVERVVAGSVGDQQRHDPGRVTGGCEPPALDGREVPPDAVHLADRRAGFQQRAVHRLLVGQSQPRCRQREQGRAAAGDQAEDEVVGREPGDQVEDPPRGCLASGIRHGVGRLDDLDARGGGTVPVARDHEPGEFAGPRRLDGAGHRGSGLAGPDDDGASAGRVRQVPGEADGGIGRRHGGCEQPPQEICRARSRRRPYSLSPWTAAITASVT